MDNWPWIIGLTQNKYAQVDEDIWLEVGGWTWTAYKQHELWYAKCWLKGKQKSLHRFIMKIEDPNILVDHINGDGLDNRRKNLRIATPAQNLINSKTPIHNTSGYKGVRWSEKRQKWLVSIQLGFGAFNTPEEAARAYDKAVKEHYGQFARLNFPEEK